MTTPAEYQLIVARTAARSIAEGLPEGVAAAVIEFLTGPLIEAPHRVGRALGKDLTGLFTARRGTYRVIYTVDDEHRTVTVLRIGHRRDIYHSP